MTCFHFLILLFILNLVGNFAKCEEFRIKTPDDTRYIIIPHLSDTATRNNTIEFQVRTCHDVYVALINGFTENEELYEIVIGGWGNKRSSFRTRKQQDPSIKSSYMTVLDCKHFKTIKIVWDNYSINVKLMNPTQQVLHWKSIIRLHPIRTIGVFTGFGSTGEWIFTYKTGQEFPVKTPDTGLSSKYILLNGMSASITTHKFIMFKVKACHDAYLALINGYNENDPLYEIVLGAYANTKTYIRPGRQQKPVATKTSLMVSCTQYRDFWIRWDSHNIIVGRGTRVNTNIFITWKSGATLRSVENVGFCTGFGATGEWVFYRTVDGIYSGWSHWGRCSHACGTGSRARTRLCNNPAPMYGGNNCMGSASESKPCNTPHCPINGGFAVWTHWGSCSSTCGAGNVIRTRSCDNPKPAYNGTNCKGDTKQSKPCTIRPCPVDGVFSVWSFWGPCSQPCGHGLKSRKRSCSNPVPKYGGANCTGTYNQSVSCNIQPCSSMSSVAKTRKSTEIPTTEGNLSTLGNELPTTTERTTLYGYTNAILSRIPVYTPITKISRLYGITSHRTSTRSSKQPKTTTVIPSHQFTDAKPTCICPCKVVGKWSYLVGHNLTYHDLNMILKDDIFALKQRLHVSKRSTSKFINIHKSASDSRQSPKYMGYFAVILICIPIMFCILLDLCNIMTLK